VYHEAKELPKVYLDLFSKYWFEDKYGARCYIVRYDRKPGIALQYLFDNGYLDDLRDELHMPGLTMEEFLTAMSASAERITKEINGCTVMVGNDTDPDGHEILVFVPAEQADYIQQISEHTKLVYDYMVCELQKIYAEDQKKRATVASYLAALAKKLAPDYADDNECYRMQLRSVFQTWMITVDTDADTAECDGMMDKLFGLTGLKAREFDSFEEFMYEGII
jgi:hypothetical protein